MDDITRDSTQDPEQSREAYATPVVTDYGTLQELTAQHSTAGTTDVPKGTHGPQVFS